ncbi:hypothetical protein A3F03_00905 [Candidatus Roizmanbacteria bacterium RIFCSPHIGHO2_12_FULL_41_11]|uniref:SH3b domain-containing protein n=3 Tax=Candidatus Roizmaniibacteriota TaxID=1752723 RepID=A0A1F7JRE6_9BACT|nr:MAG: hypothetical protein A3F03_00905 [Candidatus Roizmanbacteria bacterium RIFCSPHIGHO2_12_FULL_41_11]OGK51893.1 MAG: hypothetical protein A2966_00750 [Candidatus Roizmanbacteria bacterium RIFCSPLOWO2_01_FULL_41_22]OGK58161.1 MAG: hypothetical protein A3H86_00430 [Candidatus Roizmanbacteria bacterium RIFCSPLOWO2_02_FULL_41_9]
MKTKFLILVVLLVGFIIFLGVKFLILDKQNAYGRLKIISSPAAGVFIDSVAIGKTPYEDKYKVGEFLVKLIPVGEASSTATWQGKVKVYRNALTYVSRELGSSDVTSAGEIFTIVKLDTPPKNKDNGEVYVETEPKGAIIYLDNDEKGVGHLTMENVLKGEHELSVYLPGFFRRTQKINVEAGYRVNASFKLALDQSQKTIEQTVEEKKQQEASQEAAIKSEDGQSTITIGETPTGWLRVRDEPSLEGKEIGKVNTGEKYNLLDEQSGWYKIKIADQEGWVSGEYATKE